jgi:uncharacterized membrane protein
VAADKAGQPLSDSWSISVSCLPKKHHSLYNLLVRTRFARFAPLIPVLAGMLLLAWLVETPPGLLGKMDAIGYAVCHRIASHSFFIADRQLPLCARCLGMYLGTLTGLAFSFSRQRKGGFPPWRLLLVLGAFLLAFAVDGINSYASFLRATPLLYSPQNWLRLVTGTLLGLGMGVMLAAAFQQAVWQEYDARPALASFRQVGLLLLACGVIDLAVLSNNPLLLYPLAVLAALTVLLLLSLAYTMLWALVFKHENTFGSWRELWLFLSAGFSTALTQVIVIDIVRFALTGTWAGFSL